MKFTVQRFALSHVATAAAAVVPVRAVRPVLSNFLVTVAPGQLRVTATDLDLAIVATTGAVTSATGEGTFLLPAGRLVSILKEAADEDLGVEVSGNRAKVTCAGSHWDLTLHPDLLPEFPETPDPDKLSFTDVDKNALLAALKSVRHAVGRDVGRLALAGVSIVRDGDGSAKVTGCDSARFQQAHLASFPFTASIPAIGSPSAMDELIRVLSAYPDVQTAQAAQDGDLLVFQVGSLCFSTGRLVARPMDVESLLLAPAMANKQELTVSRDDLKSVIRRVQIAADSKSHAIGLRLAPGTLTVFARDTFRNEAQESLPVDYDGPARTLVVHYGFLNDMLDAHPAPACHFRLGPDTARKKSMVLLRDDKTQLTGVIQQLHPKSLGLD